MGPFPLSLVRRPYHDAIRERESQKSGKEIGENFVDKPKRKHGNGGQAEEVQEILARFADHTLGARSRGFLLGGRRNLDGHGLLLEKFRPPQLDAQP
jgi:hypothetical protein